MVELTSKEDFEARLLGEFDEVSQTLLDMVCLLNQGLDEVPA